MARNDNNNRDNRNHDNRHHASSSHGTQHTTAADRERRRDKVVSTVKERPYTAAALATVAAGAAAFFLTRGKSDKPLMNWGQGSQGDHVKGAGAYKQQGSTTSDRSLETASASPSSSAGASAGTGGTSPSAIGAATMSKTNTSTSASANGGAASQTGSTPSGGSASNNSPATTANAGVSSGTGASGSSASGSTGLDDKTKTETKVGAISYGA